MKTRKVYLTVDKLKADMIVAEDVQTSDTSLLTSGMVLTDDIIDKLKRTYFEDKIAVYIDENDEDNNKKGNPFYSQKTVAEINNNFTKFSMDVKKLFKSADTDIEKNMAEVRNFAKKIRDDLSSPSAVIKNVVLYGSGNDCIYRHSVNVTALSSILGKWIGLDERDISLLTYAAILHDFGKTKISKSILEKTGPLTSEERKKIMMHPLIGYNLVKRVPYLHKSVWYGVLMHHERLDGSGYLLKLKGNNIHPFAKIIAIADTFDAINSNRIYKKRKHPFAALDTIQKESLGKLDYEYCKIFIDHIINYYTEENVKLNTGETCKIIKIDPNDILHPLVMEESGFIDLKKEKLKYVRELIP